jgi:hypothetical protein
MIRLGLGRYAPCSCVAAALLAACGGSQPPMGALLQSPAQAAPAHSEFLGSYRVLHDFGQGSGL